MKLEDYNRFCASLPHSSHVVQWGGAHVWKVGGKVFAIGGGVAGAETFTFKAGEIGYEMLRQQPGLRPAPYLASRGLKWIQHHASPGLSDAELGDYLRLSHAMAARGLPRKTRIALGLMSGEGAGR